jgi:D-glycero-alpha-D-manno-heptose 1-phosphate guanylyltransferase
LQKKYYLEESIKLEVIVLAGGIGTRLKSVIADVPKPMADINNKPFLEYILNYLLEREIKKVILSVGYKYKIIQKYFGDKYNEINLIYSIEEEPLGTGGGIKLALEKAESRNVFVINGDSIFLIDLKDLLQYHLSKNANITIALKQMHNFNRYGAVKLDHHNRIIEFSEKKHQITGYINGGVYIIERNIFENLGLPKKFSFENDFLGKEINKKNIFGKIIDSYFVDIGLPEDYERLKREFAYRF